MSLAAALVKITPRESSGSETAKRFDYQKDLGLIMLIDLMESEEDFVMLFDYHDDITLIDNAINPKTISFYQVKTKASGHWLKKDLLKADIGKLSILGKLYTNKIQFDGYAISLNFITNATIKLALPGNNKDSGSLSDFSGRDLNSVLIEEINVQLKNELTLPAPPAFEGITFFKVHSLSLNDSSTHCIGALTKFFGKLNPNYNGNPSLSYKKIFNELRIKTSNRISTTLVHDISQIIEKKGITKAEFGQILESAGIYQNLDQLWSSINIELASMRAGTMLINQYKVAWREANIALMNQPNNIPLIKTVEHIKKVAKLKIDDPKFQNLGLIDLVQEILDASKPMPYSIFDDRFLIGIILKELYND